jgi:hypothetical protein
MIDNDFLDDIAAVFLRLRGWGDDTDPRLRGLDRSTELPILAAAANVVAAQRLEAALTRLEAAVRALQPPPADVDEDDEDVG